MNKKIIAIIGFAILTKFSFGATFNNTINKTISATNLSYQLDITGDGAFDITFTFFEANGAITLSPRAGNGNSFYIATGPINGVNNYPLKVKNNQLCSNFTTWKSTAIFLHNVGLPYTDYAGKGNQYIVGKMNFTGDTNQFYFWILVNMSTNGSSLNIIKSSYENEIGVPIYTGTEGQNNTTSILNIEDKYHINIYPQPAKNNVTIDGFDNLKAYSIFDIKGQLIIEQNNHTDNIINLTNLPKGIYILQLINNTNFTTSKKIVIE